jgi:anthranilate phosphoribosyltransferase
VPKLREEIGKAGLCFLHAPLFNPAMKNVAPVRKELGMKTFFNMLGPMVNPSSPRRQLVGVYSLELSRIYNYLYQQTEKDYLIVHSLDGYDEVSLTGPSKLTGRGFEVIYQPSEMGFPHYAASDLAGGSTVEAAMKILLAVLKDEATAAQKDVVTANAALAIQISHPGMDAEDSRAMARESIESGSALRCYETLMDLNKRE